MKRSHYNRSNIGFTHELFSRSNFKNAPYTDRNGPV
jgi:hypothetical protein